MKTWPKPTNAKVLHSFIGFCSYYRRFIAGFFDVVQPLYKCLEGTAFVWDAAADDAIQELKHLLTATPVFGYPTMKDPFELDTGASLSGVGAVLPRSRMGRREF